MTDDDLMDQWLRETMAGEAPQLSSAFDGKVMAKVRPRHLTLVGRIFVAAYAVGALTVSVWAMREVDVALVAASMLWGVLVALGLSSYVRAVALPSA